MRIAYIILTCEKYLFTRVKWQKNSWLKNVDENDVIFLNQPIGEETYLNAPKKYAKFLSEYENKNYDWFFFCDDDTFVFTERLKILLFSHDYTLPEMIGFKLGEFVIEGTNIKTKCCSGGAGFALSCVLVKNIKNYLRNNEYTVTAETDTSLAVWAKLSTPDFVLIDRSDLFRPQPHWHTDNENITQAVTYHYVDERDFEILNAQI